MFSLNKPTQKKAIQSGQVQNKDNLKKNNEQGAMSSNTKKWFLLALIIMGMVGNMLQVSVLFNVYFVFGSVAVMLAVAWLGLPSAIIVGAFSGIYTYFIWENPVTILVFCLEAIVVGWIYHHKIKNLIVASLIFWVLVAAPIDLILFPFWLGWSDELTKLVYLKQAINGVLNAVIASAVVIVFGLLKFAWLPTAASLLRLRHLLFCALLSVTLATGIPLILYDGYAMRQGEDRFVEQTLTSIGSELIDRLSEPAALAQFEYYADRVRIGNDVSIGLLDAQGNIVHQAGQLQSLSAQLGADLMPVNDRINMWLPSGGSNPATRFSQGVYTLVLPASEINGVNRVLLETPALPMVRAMEDYRIVLFMMLAVVIGVGILVAELISRMITNPLLRLGRSGKKLSASIANGETPTLPASRIIEFQEVSTLLEQMSNELSGTFKMLKHTQGNLENEVEQRTKALASSNNLLTSVLDAASDFAIIATDVEGTIQLFNKGAENMLEYAASEVVDKQTPLIFHDMDEVETRFLESNNQGVGLASYFELLVYQTISDKRETTEWTYITRSGVRLPIKLVVTSIQNQMGDVTGYLGIAEDISESKRVEQMKNEFVATVSHELRTPLTSISGALGMVVSGLLGTLPDTAMQMVSIANKNSQRLTLLINDLLDIEKIAAGKLAFDMQCQPLNKLLTSAIEENVHYRSERNVALKLENSYPEIHVRVDGQRLQQVMANLLSNAVKFSAEGATVTITVEKHSERVIVSVIDSGEGIPDDFKGRIFKKFAQNDASDSRAKGGTGLGLAITRELIEHMDGSIGFESQAGEGSRFWFSLPEHVIETNQLAENIAQPKARILVVEDDITVVEVLKNTLLQANFLVDIALDGKTALEHVATQRYDAITVDIGLPDISGYDVIHALREQPSTLHTPVLVVTGSVQEGQVALEGNLNDVAWLAKPIQAPHLLALLHEQVKEREKRITLLHIEDDTDLHAVISTMLNEHADCEQAISVEVARLMLAKNHYEAIILDIGLPDGEGWELLDEIRYLQPTARVIILSGQSISETDQHRVETVFLKSRISPEQLLAAIQQRTQQTHTVENG